MSRTKRFTIATGIGLLFIALNSPAQAAVSISYSPYYGVAVNYADRGYRQKYRRSNSGYGYRQYSPRSYYRSSRDYYSGYDRSYRRGDRNYYRSPYDRAYSGRRCD
ncbi:MAG: hypothetical protein GKR93_10875 [Gammaproteobacteria bacterium]|nr:hypothetical protein [Gammaproteobacteria bacterium]